MVRQFEGICDVCGAAISCEWDAKRDGMIDYKLNKQGKMVTWIRHYATAPKDANPACAVYSSEVVEVAPTTTER